MHNPRVRRFWVSVMLGGMLSALVFSAAGCGTQQSLTRTEVFKVAQLSTSMVETDFKSQVTVPVAQLSPDGIQSMQQQLIALVNSGQVQNNKDAITHAMIDLLVANPTKYITPSQATESTSVEMIEEGSGFFVTPDGYLVTNAHVVAPDQDEIKQGFAQEALQDFVNKDVQDIENELAAQGITLSNDEIQSVTKADQDYCAANMQLGDVQTSYAVELGAEVPGVAVLQQGSPASVVTVGTPEPGKDVAILKIEGKQNMPTISLGDDNAVQEGDSLYVVGYPGDATFYSVLAQSTQVEPTLTVGVLSRKVQMQDGWTALQTDATVQHGNSGGPVLNTAGQVVGLATFGVADPQSGTLEAGENFAVSISLVKEFLQQVNVTPKESMTSNLYRQAVVDMNNQQYKKALPILQEVNALLPGNPFIQADITSSQTNIISGNDRSGPAWWAWILYILAALVVVALIIAGKQGRLEPWLRLQPG